MSPLNELTQVGVPSNFTPLFIIAVLKSCSKTSLAWKYMLRDRNCKGSGKGYNIPIRQDKLKRNYVLFFIFLLFSNKNLSFLWKIISDRLVQSQRLNFVQSTRRLPMMSTSHPNKALL